MARWSAVLLTLWTLASGAQAEEATQATDEAELDDELDTLPPEVQPEGLVALAEWALPWLQARVAPLYRQADPLWLARWHPTASIGRPSDGALLFGVRMEPIPGVDVRYPDDSWATPEVIAALRDAHAEVRSRHPGGMDLSVGDISREGGGRFPPHHTHRSGRDVDMRYYVTGKEPGDLTYTPATVYNLDVVRVWALIEVLRERDQIEVVYMDERFQRLLYKYARKQLNLTDADLAPILSYPRARRHPDALVQHVRGHYNHLHLRFRSPRARLFGALISPEVAAQVKQRLDLARKGYFEHTVRSGETLGSIAAAHRVPLKSLMRWNRLRPRSVLRPGKTLRIRQEQPG